MRFILVDAILELELGKQAKGVKNVSLSEDFFDDHFPLKPIMPGVLIVEGMAQVSGLLLEESMRRAGKKVKALMSLIEKVKFRQPVYPGTQILYTCNILQMNEFGGKISATAMVGGEIAVECALLFSFHEFGNSTQDAIRARVLETLLAGARPVHRASQYVS
ncbi:MAG: 3-hydroxyacyl-ACP dehydratase FabZ [Clostridiales Family XIII bacterium]|jgi:3-hydroxyacyl-[acyl-carrier-protein] dehydratase|nr:3-hydroxyacyl-ACP dehydratase FabZ [Clostridiales Family XIII bacterium]